MARDDKRDTAYDTIILGTGQGGKPLAHALAEAGRRVAIVERGPVGGSCVNYGCTPTKTMLASARIAHLARRAGDYGVEVGEVSVDLERVRERKRGVVESFREGGRKGLEKADGIDLVRGHGRFVSEREVEVELGDGGSRRLEAERIVIDTGTRPRLPPIDGLDAVPTLDNTTVMELGSVPEHLLVLGGGYIGVEFGQMFARFGARVTIVQRDPQLLTREDDDVGRGIAEILEDDGIEILFDAETRRAETSGDGGVRLTVEADGGTRTLEGTHLLVAAGRAPNTDDLGLDAAGVATDERGYVQVDGGLETNVPGVYALGDVKGGPAFTHISYDDFRILRANLLEGGRATTEGRLVPYTLFTDPQLGRVGLGEKQAEREGRRVRVAKLPMEHVARAIETDETRGFMKALVDPESERILGCAILGIEGGEVMSVVQTAMLGKLSYRALAEGAYAHPTLAESLNNLFSQLD